jgi:hypothetical protein
VRVSRDTSLSIMHRTVSILENGDSQLVEYDFRVWMRMFELYEVRNNSDCGFGHRRDAVASQARTIITLSRGYYAHVDLTL